MRLEQLERNKMKVKKLQCAYYIYGSKNHKAQVRKEQGRLRVHLGRGKKQKAQVIKGMRKAQSS